MKCAKDNHKIGRTTLLNLSARLRTVAVRQEAGEDAEEREPNYRMPATGTAAKRRAVAEAGDSGS